jgi:hypothetical protein
MRIRWYRLAVFVLWLAATGWLVRYKIVPSLLVGDVPLYGSTAGDAPRPPVAWNLSLDKQRLGWAWSEITHQPTDVTEIHSLVYFDGLPFTQLLPGMFRQLVPTNSRLSAGTPMKVESHMLLVNSPLNQLQSFSCKVRPFPFTGQSLVSIEGNVEGDTLMVTYRYLDWPQQRMPLDLREYKIRDSLSPETELRGLRLGQHWSIVTYNPLTLPSNPLELLQHRASTEVLLAWVEEATSLLWNGQAEPVWLVVYRTDTSEGSDNNNNIRNRLWVRMDGTVLRQEVRILGRSLAFVRMTDEEATKLRAERKEAFGRQL